MVLSLVALLAVIDITDEKSSRDFQEQWSLAMAATSMCVAFLACLGHGLQGLRERFVSSAMELVCVRKQSNFLTRRGKQCCTFFFTPSHLTHHHTSSFFV